jgi:hypothetical protein
MKFGNQQRKKKYGEDYILWDFRPNILTDFSFLNHYLLPLSVKFWDWVCKKYKIQPHK